MAAVFSTAFARVGIVGATDGTVYRVPAGHTAVLRCIGYSLSAPGGFFQVRLEDPGGTIVSALYVTNVADVNTKIVDVRMVIPERFALRITSDFNVTNATLDGYLFAN